jgi:hypothetical protein
MATNPSTGITEVSAAVAAMMDNPSLVPSSYPDMDWDERAVLHKKIAACLSFHERRHILDRLSDPQMALEYSAKYLSFLASYRDYGDNYALWLSDYNRGLSRWNTVTEYGRRIEVFGKDIAQALWQEAEIVLLD